MRVKWSTGQELSADDICQHFEMFGEITDVEWLDEPTEKGMEVMKLRFKGLTAVADIMQNQPHQVTRESDGKVVQVSAYVKFSDNESIANG